MIKREIFGWLVRHHCRENLPKCLEHMVDGAVNVNGAALEEGSDSNQVYPGALVVVNGDTLMSRLRSDNVILDTPEEIGDALPLRGEDDLSVYLSSFANDDGAYVVDSVHRIITKVHEINNSPQSMPPAVSPYDMLPADFIYASQPANMRARIGTKTRLAIRLPLAYTETETFQIKRSAYGNTRIGKVTHFTGKGLAEEFFFRYDPSRGTGPYGIVGVHRAYSRSGLDGLMKVRESEIYPVSGDISLNTPAQRYNNSGSARMPPVLV